MIDLRKSGICTISEIKMLRPSFLVDGNNQKSSNTGAKLILKPTSKANRSSGKVVLWDIKIKKGQSVNCPITPLAK